MNVLVSAYACEPNKGSEPSVGWNWVTNMSKNNKMFVVTRENNKENIETESIENIEFYYYDLPKVFKKLKKITKSTILYYYLWQFGAYREAKRIINKNKIDIAHHVTFANFKVFSFLALFDIPYILGPVGGGERSPYNLYNLFTKKQLIKEIFRDIDILLCRFNPLTRLTWKKAKKILVTTNETKNKIPKKYREKVEVMQAIGIEEDLLNSLENQPKIVNTNKLNIGYVGNLLELKGIDILIDSFYKYHKYKNSNSVLTIIGDGPGKSKIKNKIRNYNIESSINFLGRVSREEAMTEIKDFDIFVFPSLHDSGALAVLEAMANNIPVIVLNLGGPGNNVNSDIGIVIEPKNYDYIVEEIAASIDYIYNDKDECIKMCQKANMYLRDNFTWSKKAKKMNILYKMIYEN